METWPQWLTSAKHIAQAADWVRWKTQDRARIVIAVGANSIAVAKSRQIDAEDAVAILADLQDQIARALRHLDLEKATHTSVLIQER
jgi:hypothetical protein